MRSADHKNAALALMLAVGCGGVRVVDDDGVVGGAVPIGGGGGADGGMPPGGSGGEPGTGGSGYGGACQDGFIELSGPTGARLESVCDWGSDVTDRPVGYFYTIGPQAGGDFRIQGCTEPGFVEGLFFTLASSPGTATGGAVSYLKDGVEWTTVYEAFSVTTEPFDYKIGTAVVGSYAVTVTDGQDTMDLFGSFSLCRVTDSGAP